MVRIPNSRVAELVSGDSDEVDGARHGGIGTCVPWPVTVDSDRPACYLVAGVEAPVSDGKCTGRVWQGIPVDGRKRRRARIGN